MYIKKVTLASLVLVSLSACHGGSSTKIDKSEITELNQQITEAKQANKQAQETNDKLVKQLKELQKAAVNNSELSKQVDELKQKLANKNIDSSNDELNKLKEKIQVLQAEINNIKKIEAERIAVKERKEAERLAAEKAEAERIEKQRVDSQLSYLKDLAINAGMQVKEAEDFAQKYLDSNYSPALEDIRYNNVKEKALKAGLSMEQAEQLGSQYRFAYDITNADWEIQNLVQEKERLATEKAEQERLELERLEAEKLKLEELRVLALKAGYSDLEAAEFAKSNLNNDPNYYLSALSNEKYEKVKSKALEAGLSEEQAASLAYNYSTVDADINNVTQDIVRLVEEKAERESTRVSELKRLATKAGLSEPEVEKFVEDYRDTEDSYIYLSSLGMIKYEKVKEAALKEGLSEESASLLASNYSGVEENLEDAFSEIAKKAPVIKAKGVDDDNYGLRFDASQETTEGKIKVRTQSYLYNQPYSVVKAQEIERKGWENGKYIDTSDKTITVKGLKTEQLPTEGKATYEGKAFNYYGDTGHSGGFLTYDVDFTNRTGSGRVEGDWGMYIVLDKGNIEKNSISSTTQQHYGESHYVNGRYNIEFFGKNAEEIAGEIQTDKDPNGRIESFGLAGTRGEIQK